MSGELVSAALVADTHGWLDPRVAEVVARCDIAVHAGDVGGASVLDALRPRCGECHVIRGNNDVASKWPASDCSILDNLPRELRLALPGGDLVVVHGDDRGPAAERHQRLRRRHAGAAAVLYGHSHRRVCDTDREPWVLNPGAAGRVRTFGGPSCLVLLAGRDGWRVQTHVFEPPGRSRAACL